MAKSLPCTQRSLVAFLINHLPKTRRDGGEESQLLVSVSNIPGLNPQSLPSAYDVKVYVNGYEVWRFSW